MICPQFRPLTGGYERAAERLSQALVGQGRAVTVVTERRLRDWPVREAIDGVQVRRWWCIYRSGLHTVTSLLGLATWLLGNGRAFHLWHVHQYGVHATLAVLLGKLLQRPVVLKLTSSGQQGISVSLKSLRAGALHRWTHQRVQACIAVSEELATEALAFGIPTERIHQIGNGVRTTEFRPPTSCEAERARRAIPGGAAFVAIAVGRLAIEKNPLGMLQAWAMALPRLPAGAKLVWVGDGPLRSEVEARIDELSVRPHVLLVGYSKNVLDWYMAADMFLLSSRNEGMANTLLEAMACGLASVATGVSGVPQLLGETGAGVVVPIGDMNAFADAIVALVKDAPRRARMGKQARATVETHYSIDVTASRVLTVYATVCTHE